MVGSGAAAVTLAYNADARRDSRGRHRSRTPAVSGRRRSPTPGTGPQVTHTVATTSASGVTTYTTTQVVNGKTVVTHVHQVPTAAYHDD